MCADLYTVGLQVDTSQLQQGTTLAKTSLQQLGQAESQLERQTKSVDAASQGLGQTETALARSIAVTEQAARKQGAAMDDLGKRTQTASSTQKALTSGLQGLLGPLTSVHGAVGAFGAYLGGQFIRSVLETAGHMQTLQLSLDAITGSTRAGADAMLFIRQTANQLGVGTAELAQNYRQFVSATQGANLGLTTQRQLITGLVAANKVAGGSTETLANAMRALNQIIGLGKVTAENWTGQLEDALPGITNKTAAALGLTTEKFRELMAAGQLGIDRVFPALITVLGQDIPKAAAIAGSSIEGETARMKNSLTDFFSAIGQSPLMQAFTKNIGDATRWLHDFGAALGALNPRPLTAIEQITERITLLRRETNLSGQRSLETNQQLAELETQRLALIKQQAQQQKLLAEEEDKRKQAATTGPTGVTKTLSTQIDQETAAMQRRYEVGRTVGLSQLERERAKLSDLNKVLQEHLDVLASTTPMTDADRKAREAQARAVQDQIEATEGVIKTLQDEERERNKPAKVARQGRATLSDEQRAANDLQRDQNQLVDELAQAYDRATQSEAGLLALRARRLQFTESEIQELLTHQALTQEAEKQKQAADAAQQAYASSLETLKQELDILQHAQEMGVSLEQAREEVAISLVARSDEELQTLIAMNDQRREALTLLDAQQERLNAVASTAALMIEAEVRGPDPERTSGLERVKKDFDLLQESADTFADNFLAEINRVTDGAAFSFTRFAESAIRDLARILQQQFVAPQIASWTQKGLEWGLQLLGAAGGAASGAGAAGATANLGTALGGTGGLQFGAVGGPVRRGLTLVGEAGPEVIASGGGRSMVFPTSHPLTRRAMASSGIARRQYGGPLPEMGLGMGQEPSSEQPAMPGAVPPGQRTVVQNFYITTPDASSFMQSRAAVQRAMAQAVRSSQTA